jgi:hypothetical protein
MFATASPDNGLTGRNMQRIFVKKNRIISTTKLDVIDRIAPE